MVKKWVVYAGRHHQSALLFLEEFAKALRTHHPFPIRRFFELFPLNPTTKNVVDRLVRRGDIMVNQQELTNTGPFADTRFHDEVAGDIGMYFPKDLKATFALNADSVEVRMTGGDVLITLYALPPDLGIGPRFVFRGSTLTRDRHTHSLEDDLRPGVFIDVVVDLTRDPPRLDPGRLLVPTLDKVRSLAVPSGDDPPPGGSPPDDPWGDPNAPWNRTGC